MSSTTTQNTNNPTEIVGLDTIKPRVEFLTEKDLVNFTYTGINIKLKVPLVKDSDKALFAINTDGLIVGPTFRQDTFKGLMINMFPVQIFENAQDYVEVTYEPIALPILHMFYSYRFVKGKARIGLRLSSNVSQTGNLIVSQASGLQRRFYSKNESYKGLHFLNAENTSSTFAPAGLITLDVSINRDVGITPINRENMPAVDIMQKLSMVNKLFEMTTRDEVENANHLITSQFLEEWLLFTPQNNLPNTNGGELEFGLYMDWSEISFDCPGMPIQPISMRWPKTQILGVTQSFNNRRGVDINLSTPLNWQTELHWQPGTPTTKLLALAEKEEEEEQK